MAPVAAAVAAIGTALGSASVAIGAAVGLGSGVLGGVVGGAVLGGVLGAATSALVGGDIKKGALLGAIGGAVSGGFAGAKAIETAKLASSGASGSSAASAGSAASSSLGGASLAAMPEQLGALGAQTAVGSTGGYSLGADGIIGSMTQIGDKVAPLATSAANTVGQAGAAVGSSGNNMVAYLAAMKEVGASQSKWLAGTEAVKMGVGALMDDGEDDALRLQREAIESKKINLSGVDVPRMQGQFGGASETGGVASSLADLRNKGLLGGAGRYDYAKRTA